ncbi:hypothetical protein C2845_PM15G22150 [Panicum miliaceum]|uniref:Uncharacterized protein n=1 Tax=Panicum miliaceum TaxID=4540 RepID=A0A3L6Q4N2_PANMI|nr:hypothetical protein C2845_PM15G22150 [Panicum miliaceum]
MAEQSSSSDPAPPPAATSASSKSPHLKRSSTKEIQIAISDYFRLYFPDAISPKNQVNENSLWQFVMVLEAPPKADDGSKLPKSRSRPSFRCLACQWVAADQSIASIHYHFGNTKSRKGCPRIPQHLINRLNAVGGLGGVYLNLEELMAHGNKKWKQPLASVAPQFVPSVDAAGGVDTVGGILQKVEAARAISSSLLDLLASDAPDIDRTKTVEKLREQKAILQELKSDCMKPSLELSPAPQLPISCKASAPSKELSSAPQLSLPISSKGSVPSKELSSAPQLSLPISSKASAASKEPSPAPQLSLPISSEAFAPSKEPSPVPQLFLPVSSKASGNFDTLFGGLGNLFPEENFDEESMEYLHNICPQTIPEEQLEQSYPEFFPPSPSTQS